MIIKINIINNLQVIKTTKFIEYANTQKKLYILVYFLMRFD